jgi:transcription antitermination factor NusG
MTQERDVKAHWYLLYTNPRFEKKVEAELFKRGYEVFLPMHKTLKHWSDRKKWVEEPLFKSYIFIYTVLEKEYFDILNVTGIVKFVNFENKPAVVDSREIALVRLMLGVVGDKIEVNSISEIVNGGDEKWEMNGVKWEVGEEVEVIAGPLIGTKGKLIYKNGNKLLQIELESMQQSLLVSMPVEFVKVSKINKRIQGK